MSQPRRHPNPAAPTRSRLERRAPHLLHRRANPSPDPNPNPNPNRSPHTLTLTLSLTLTLTLSLTLMLTHLPYLAARQG